MSGVSLLLALGVKKKEGGYCISVYVYERAKSNVFDIHTVGVAIVG